MNHLLQHISWITYLTSVLLLLIPYYLFISVRFYGPELHCLFRHLSGQQTTTYGLPDAMRYEGPEEVSYPSTGVTTEAGPDNRPDDTIDNTDELIGQLKACIQTSGDKPFAPAVLVPQLKKLLRADPGLQHSPYRPAINELIVAECERTGTALLTEDEVDQWWSE